MGFGDSTQIERKERETNSTNKCHFAFKLPDIKANWYCPMELVQILRNDRRLPPSKPS
jgi:hypothetical protein